MEIQAAIDLFLQNYLAPKHLSAKTFEAYQNELAAFEHFCREQNILLSQPEELIKALDHFFINQSEQFSPARCRKIYSRLRVFFKYLHHAGIIPQNWGLLLQHLPGANNDSPKIELLRQLRELEHILYDLKRIGTIRKRFSNIKKEVVKVGKHNLPLHEHLFKAGIDEVSQMKARVKEELDRQINDLFWVGSIVLNGDIRDLSNELGTLTKNVSKMGREQYKVNTIGEAREQSNKNFYENVLNRIGNTETFLEELARLNRDAEKKINLDFVKELLPVIDGLEEAIGSIPEINRFQPHKTASKSFFKQLLAGPDENASTEPVKLEQWFEGLTIIHNRLMAILKKSDISVLKSIGEPFDPRYHIAVGVKYRTDIEENIIIEEQIKGYHRNDELIRYAEVIVSKHQ